MTTGEELIDRLGISSLTYIRYKKFIFHPKILLVVYYNSYRPFQPISNDAIKANDIAQFLNGDEKPVRSTPAFNLRDYNGAIDNKIIVSVDLSGDHLVRQYEELSFEKKRLDEFLHLSDLKSKSAASDFTLKFADERRGIMGNENTVSKLKRCIVNAKKDYADFIWYSKSTDKYPPNHKTKKVLPSKNFKLVPNKRGLYYITLRVYGIQEWLKANPDDHEIDQDDLLEILKVADLKAFSNSPAFQYQGSNYNMSQIDGSIYPTSIPPTIWKDKHGDGQNFLDKHMSNIFMQLGFWSNNMAAMLQKQLKNKGLI